MPASLQEEEFAVSARSRSMPWPKAAWWVLVCGALLAGSGGVAAVGRPWRIRDRRGQVDLTFEPEAIRTVDINVGLLRSRYRGPFGAFRGRIAAGEGDLEVDGWFGMCEDFYLRA